MNYSDYFTILNIDFPVREKLYHELNYAISKNLF